MTEPEKIDIGALIVAYAHAKWGQVPNPDTVEKIGPKLGRDLQLRLDVLGVDGEHLLNIAPHEALGVLEDLEREAEAENFQAARRSDPFDDAMIVHSGGPDGRTGRPRPNPVKRQTHGPNRRRRQQRSDR